MTMATCEVTKETKETELIIDGTKYLVISQRKTTPSPDALLNQKLQDNLEKQEEEVKCLDLEYKDLFKIVDQDNKKYSIDLFVRGAPEASFQFSMPPQYPSDVPPIYNIIAPWVRKKTLAQIYRRLVTIFNEKFGRCIIYFWIEQILTDLMEEIKVLKLEPPEEEKKVVQTPVKKKESYVVYQGTKIEDRGSSFSPYLAQIKSENDVKKAIAQIESCKSVATAWRNTYAYRYESNNKMVEFGEDGGEPRAGKNLLQRLVNYDATDVLVYISRRLGGSMLGPARFKHLNNAADEVLTKCGYRPESKKTLKSEKKGNKGKTKK